MSDARRVKKVRTITKALEKLLKVTPVEYKLADNDPDFVPDFIAQDLAKVFPQYVGRLRNNDNGTDPIPPKEEQGIGFKGWFISRLDVLIPWLVSALQELADDLDQLKKRTTRRVKEVDDKIAAIEVRLAALEASVPANQQRIVTAEDRITALEKINAAKP